MKRWRCPACTGALTMATLAPVTTTGQWSGAGMCSGCGRAVVIRKRGIAVAPAGTAPATLRPPSVAGA